MINIRVKNEREKEKKALLLPRSFKYLDLSKNIKETRVQVIFKDGPLLSCFFTYTSHPLMQGVRQNIFVCRYQIYEDMQISDSFRYHVCLFQMNKQLSNRRCSYFTDTELLLSKCLNKQVVCV